MNSVLDSALVGLALLVSAVYALLTLGPKSLRRSLLAGAARLTARAPEFLGSRRASQWLATAAAGKPTGSCGGCDDCGPKEAAGSDRESEIKVPVTQIKRRA